MMRGKRVEAEQAEPLRLLKIQISAEDLATLSEWGGAAFRTPSGQASFLLKQIIEKHRVDKGAASALNGRKEPLAWETGR